MFFEKINNSIMWRSDDDQIINNMLQFYDTNLISTYHSIYMWFEYFLNQSMIEWIDQSH